MPPAPFSVAVWRYDRTQALYDGRVRVRDRTIQLIDAPLEEIFTRAFTHGEFEVSELSFSNFLRLSVAGKCPYLGLPIFPSRSFRHGTFYVRNDGTIRSPQDLVGRKVGLREYSMTAALTARGALRDHFGVDTAQIQWVMGDVDQKERDEIALPVLHRPVSLTVAPAGALLDDMLLAGDIDGILAYKPIRSYRSGAGKVRRLFENFAELEEQYFTASRIFPIMHLMGIRRDVVASDPEAAPAIYEALAEAHRLAMEDLRLEQALKISLPWLAREVDRTVSAMGEDFWPSGLARNRAVLERMIDWSWTDGLIAAPVSPDSLFCEALHAT